MKRTWLLVTGLALVLAIVGLSGCNQGDSALGEGLSNLRLSLDSQQAGIWVTGEGKVSAAPDILSLRLGIEAQAESVAEAQPQAAEAMNQVMTALTDNGVDDTDIETQYFSIRQVTKWDRDKEENIVVGYQVSNMVTAEIRDIDNAGSIIDAVAEAGGDLTRINSISFSIDDPTAYHEEAREEAMADAKAKAGQLANLAGVTLGKPTYISEGTQTPAIYQRAMSDEAIPAAATPISPGELDITLTVQVAYAILN